MTIQRQPWVLLWGVVLACVIGFGQAHSQSTSATLEGEVRSANGKAVPDAVLQARSEASGAVRIATSDSSGHYRLDSLTPGTWTVVARLADGAISESRTVRLGLQQTVTLDFTAGSATSERVVVRAEMPLVDRKETAGALRVSADQANGLPLSGRVFTDLALLDASVGQAAPGNYFGERGAVFVVNGQSGRSNSFLVDGLDNNDQTSGTTLNAFYSQQVIQEFVLLTHQYSPEFGRASGGVLNIVTRRGGNTPSWEAFVQGAAGDLSEPGGFVERLPDSNIRQDTPRRYQAGFRLGGPIRKDKAFYFVAYERQESDDVGFFTGNLRDGTAGGRLIAPAKDDNFFVRTDFNLGRANTLMVRLSADDRTSDGVNVQGVYTPESGFRIEERDLTLAASLTTVVSPNVVNEVRFLASTSEFGQRANSDRPGVSRPSGIFGGNNLYRQDRDEDRFQIVENLTWQHGTHRIKAGIDVTHSRTRLKVEFNPNGNFIYDYDFAFEPGDCGSGVTASEALDAAFDGTVPCPGQPNVDDDNDGIVDEPANILSYPLVYSLIDGDPESLLDDTNVALFVQDKWEVGHRWLFDYGLRYDVSSYELPRSAAVDSILPNGGSRRDTDNLAPRFGFTFTPGRDEQMVLRGGGGIFYDKLVLAFPAVAAITSGTEIGLFFPEGFAIELTEDLVELVGGDAIRDSLFFPEELTLRFSTGTELQTPYTVQYNFGVDLGIGRNAALQVDVIRAQGYHLPLMKDLNPVTGLRRIGQDCSLANIEADLEVGIPCHVRDPTVGSIAALVTEGRSWYSALDLNWRWQHEDTWLRASYTYSRAEDQGFDPLKGGIALPPDSDDLAGERGRSDGDRRHRMVLSGQTGLPWLGMRASAVLQLSSGLPFNVTTGMDDNLDGLLSDRPAGVGRNTGGDTPLRAVNELRQEFNDIIQSLNSQQIGNGLDGQPLEPLDPISKLRESNFAQLDLRLSRPIVFGRGKGQGEMFLQIFNMFDRENAGLIEGRAISRQFGEAITLAGPPRTLELGLKFGY